jgi:CBS domain-containing protein
MFRLLCGLVIGALGAWAYWRRRQADRVGQLASADREPAAVPMLPVREVMTREVVSVPPSLPVPAVRQLLETKHLSAAPVVDEQGHVLGIVSDLDLLSRPGLTVGERMSPRVISVSAETPVDEVAHVFVNERVRSLPVLDRGQLVLPGGPPCALPVTKGPRLNIMSPMQAALLELPPDVPETAQITLSDGSTKGQFIIRTKTVVDEHFTEYSLTSFLRKAGLKGGWKTSIWISTARVRSLPLIAELHATLSWLR